MEPINKSNQAVTWKGQPLHLRGTEVREGDLAPDFRLVGAELNDVTYDRFEGQVLVISVVPSVDTSTCAVQTKRFDEIAQRFAPAVSILTVSMDLPFAQTRWCGAESCAAIMTASDYKYRSFGELYGVAIDDLGLLARAVFVVGLDRVIRHVEYVSSLSAEPNYAAVCEKVSAALAASA